MGREEVLAKLKRAIEEQDVDLAEEGAKEALAEGIDPLEAIEEGLSKGMKTISDLFDEGEIFVPQIIIAADAFMRAVKILEQAIPKEEVEKSKRGKVLIHTVQGDIHDVGKNIVSAMLSASGFEVIDLGRDVPVDEVVKKAKELDVDIVAASSLMTTSMPAQRDIVKGLEEAGLKGRVKCLFGGAPVTKEWVEKIGGDGYGSNAAEAVAVAKELVS